MASQGPLSPSAASTSIGNAGTIDWSDPGNVFAADGSIATASGSGTTRLLLATGFGFAIPTGATINGIVVEVYRFFSGTSAADANIEVLKAGSPAGTDASAGAAWSSAGYFTYGSSSDLWGTTWTVAEVNASDFGAAVAATLNGTASVDHVRMTVYYTAAAFDPATFSHPQSAPGLLRRAIDAVAY